MFAQTWCGSRAGQLVALESIGGNRPLETTGRVFDEYPAGRELFATADRRAIAELCTLLNATDPPFPGTSLRLRYAVRAVEPAT